jgi:hypothetical protein
MTLPERAWFGVCLFLENSTACQVVDAKILVLWGLAGL